MKNFNAATLFMITALSISGTATASLAEYVIVNRGPNSAGHVVKRDRIPLDANYPLRLAPNKASIRSNVIRPQESRQSKTAPASKTASKSLVTRGPNGAGFLK